MLQWFGKRLNELHEKNRDERGFTLIELLVVVIIIGILAAIAIPVFLNQRQEAQSRAAQSNLRNAATAQQAFFTAKGVYTSTKTGGTGTAPNDLSDVGFREGTPTVTITDPAGATGSTFCMTAQGGGTTWKFADSDGAPVEGGSC